MTLSWAVVISLSAWGIWHFAHNPASKVDTVAKNLTAEVETVSHPVAVDKSHLTGHPAPGSHESPVKETNSRRKGVSHKESVSQQEPVAPKEAGSGKEKGRKGHKSNTAKNDPVQANGGTPVDGEPKAPLTLTFYEKLAEQRVVLPAEMPGQTKSAPAKPAVNGAAAKPGAILAGKAPGEAIGDHGPYFVQVGAFPGFAEAAKLVSKLQGEGTAAQISRQSGNQAELYSVRIGPFPTRDAARQAMSRNSKASINPRIMSASAG
ncbi:MAG: SPOR domain-containing protein [Magnetococcales bacterium]|nr:SPOR domain-containing protein [Magnetococcales bacterium]